MELNPKIKQALIKIDFVKRYEELSRKFNDVRTPSNERLRYIDGETVMEMIRELQYSPQFDPSYRIKKPIFGSYEDLEEILHVAFEMYEDFKSTLITIKHPGILICSLSSRQVKYLKTIMTTVSSDAVVLFSEQLRCYTNSYCSCLTSYLEHIYLSTPCRRCFAVLTDRYVSRFFTLKSNKNYSDSR